MLPPLEDTIAAIASARGGAARGIVRLSGPDALGCLARIFEADDGRAVADLVRPEVVRGDLRTARPWPPAPCEVFVWPDARSYTGQPSVEIHTLGCPPLLDAVLNALGEAGARLARPGEFTLRAFLAGRLDLTQAEAVLGVIDATDSTRLDAALEQLAGGLAHPLAGLREALLDTLAHLEAGFDFADEDIRFIDREKLGVDLAAASATVARLLGQMQKRGDARASVRVVLKGRPNTGKSSLFNALAATGSRGTYRAIVSDEPGATRDYLVADVSWDGHACQLIDTAGLEDGPCGATRDPLSGRVQATSHRLSLAADIELMCLDATRRPDAWEIAEATAAASRRLVVWTKCDAGDGGAFPVASPLQPQERLTTSAATGQGIGMLVAALCRRIDQLAAREADVVVSTAVRCRESLVRAGDALATALDLSESGREEELIAAELRIALESLGVVVGAVHAEDVLDRVFSRFCVGK